MSPTIGKKITRENLNLDRLKTLVLYICYIAKDPSVLGATKLNKILWYSDVLAYRDRGKSLTGETYIKHLYGPVPKHIDSVIMDLEGEKKLAVREVDAWGYPKKEFFALSKPELLGFEPEEISIVSEVANYVFDHHTATSISDLSHDGIWQSAELGEEIPIYAFLASELGEITSEDVLWAKQKLSESTRK